MKNWRKYYEDHLMPLEEAVKQVESGDTIWLNTTTGLPYRFLDLLAERKDELEDVTLISNMIAEVPKVITGPEYKKAFHYIDLFYGGVERAYADNIDLLSIPFSKVIPVLERVYHCNAIVMEVAPPDEDGYCNVGVQGVSYNPLVTRLSTMTKVFAVINKNASIARGKDDKVKIHVSRLDYISEWDRTLVPPSGGINAGKIDQEIAHQILPYIKHGDTVQIGMGGIPDTIGKELAQREDMKAGISIHTEITTDCMVEMEASGVLVHVKTCGAYGTQKLYDWMATTNILEFDDIDGMLDPDNIANIPNMRSILSCMMIDLRGQVAAEGVGHMHYSGVGGQVDFLEGTSKGRLKGNGSTSFMTLHSARKDKNGKLHSNIVLDLPEGTVVTSNRNLPMYVVTEYGAVDIFMKPVRDRVPALISIAHPDFREGLKKQALESGLVDEEDFARFEREKARFK